LIPFPPLDGSKLLFAFAPISEEIKMQLEHYGFMVLIFIIFLFPALFYPISILISSIISLFFKFIVGIPVGPML
jgi:Zn-dependent protease